MKNTFKKISSIALLGLIVASNKAMALDELMRPYRGVRSLGMGGVTTTTGLYDEALFNNPAMMTEIPNWRLTVFSLTVESNFNLMSDYNDFKKLTGEKEGATLASRLSEIKITGRNQHARLTLLMPAYYTPTFISENMAFGVGLLFQSQFNAMVRGNSNVETQIMNDLGPAFNFAYRLLDNSMSVGLNIRTGLRVSGDDTITIAQVLDGRKAKSLVGTGVGIDGDFGVNYKLPMQETKVVKGVSFAGSLNNLANSSYQIFFKNKFSSYTGNPLSNDRTGSLGARLDFQPFSVFQENLVAVEMSKIGNTRQRASFWKRLHMGGETKFLEHFFLRLGMNQGYITAGAAVDWKFVKFDVSTYGEELSAATGYVQDRRLVARLQFDI